jgi:hypothetical protein
MSQKHPAGERMTVARAIELVRESGIVTLDTTVAQLLDTLRDQERRGELEAAKIKNGGVAVTKCFLIVTTCE